MRTADAQAVVAEPGAVPFRIRHLLVFGLIGLLAWMAVPRARAAWELHSAASTFADYALCMVGPTGPAALRDNPTSFWRLVRRRIITAPATERPFSDCAAAAGELTGSVSTRRAHLAVASDFVEYGGAAADRASKGSRHELSIASLLVTTRPLARLAERAKPLVRGGYTRLVKPSSHAKEAVHAVELPRPAMGRGLPSWGALYEAAVPTGAGHVLTVGQGANRSVFRSDDGGINWRVASLGDPAAKAVAGRCPAGTTGAAFAFGLSEDRTFKTVRSLLPDGSESRARLVPRAARVFAAACDEEAAVVATGNKGSRDVEVLVCRFQGSCSKVALPAVGNGAEAPRYPVDVARLGGVTVVSTAMHGLVRVASSRDDGQTWTPWSVAYDPSAHAGLGANLTPPVQMLALGQRILLYGGGDTPTAAYPVLFSDDFGASWRGR